MPRSKQNPQEPEQVPAEVTPEVAPEVTITIEDAPVLTIEDAVPAKPRAPAEPLSKEELPNGITIENF